MVNFDLQVPVFEARVGNSPCGEVSSYPHNKRKEKAIKAQGGHFIYVLGHDVYMEQVEALCNKALIGKLEYCRLGKKD